MFLLEKDHLDNTLSMKIVIYFTFHNNLFQWQINKKELSINTSSY